MQDQIHTHEHFLYILAESQLDKRLRGKLDAGDLVQETLARASLAFDQCREPDNFQVVRCWLQQILANVLADERKKFQSGKRNVELERAIAVEIDHSASNIQAWLTANHTSPSMAAARNEEYSRLATALASLPCDLREVVMWKHIKNKPLKEIAAALGKSDAAVAGMLRRGLSKLRKAMA